MSPRARRIFAPLVALVAVSAIAAGAVAVAVASYRRATGENHRAPRLMVLTPPSGPARAPSADRAAAASFTHHLLDLEAAADPIPASHYGLLDTLIRDTRAKLAAHPEPADPRERALRILRAIDDVLTEQRFCYPYGEYDVPSLRLGLTDQYYDEPTRKRLLRVGYNARRRAAVLAAPAAPVRVADCDILSLIYLGVAEAVGLELHLIDMPDHMIVAWKPESGARLNWDPIDATSSTDDELAESFDVTAQHRARGVYLVTLSRDQAEGYAHSLVAGRREEQGRPDLAIESLRQSLALYPKSPAAQAQLARLLATPPAPDPAGAPDRIAEAAALADSAVDLDPTLDDAWCALAHVRAARGDFPAAADAAHRAVWLSESDGEHKAFKELEKAFRAGHWPTRD